MKTATATEIKNRFGEYLQSAIREPVLIEKTGKPVAVLLSIDDYERLSALEDAYWIMKAQKAEAGGYLGVTATKKFIGSRLKKLGA
ncbi:MAG: type II toxin-antitoxin system Phd/YefM family antitoxin [Nitrospinae bacterium]|nr:type II toxin-antitoxin system Phd/YefM family antitoxin [Nitrospinota bacterium]MBF0633034.1 type II toxin-antitoxin system Phd/YefM family antitoxin [Nitrospinota bacterium]